MVENMDVSRTVISVIAANCRTECKNIQPETLFMQGQTISYLEAMDSIFDLQHKFKIKLPEHEYQNYNTVGDLIRQIKSQKCNNI